MSVEEHLKVAVTHLELVDVPISNTVAARIEREKITISHLHESDFYMLTGRAAARFEKVRYESETSTIHFEICVGSTLRDSGYLQLDLEPAYAMFEGKLTIRGNSEVIEAIDGVTGKHVILYTPDSLLWWKARHRAGIFGLTKARELSTFDLLYVGIATKGDSVSRLLKRGHKQRGQILAGEKQRVPGARVSDETYLFFFRVVPTVITTFDPHLELTDADFDPVVPLKRYVADAEKAFVSLLKPPYNDTLYDNYPKSIDGLHREGLRRYNFSLAEEMILISGECAILGARGSVEGMPMSNRADIIAVEGESVRLHKAGVDFGVEETF